MKNLTFLIRTFFSENFAHLLSEIYALNYCVLRSLLDKLVDTGYTGQWLILEVACSVGLRLTHCANVQIKNFAKPGTFAQGNYSLKTERIWVFNGQLSGCLPPNNRHHRPLWDAMTTVTFGSKAALRPVVSKHPETALAATTPNRNAQGLAV